MENIISNSEIQATAAYEKLEPCFKNLVLKLSNKKIISSGLLIHKNSGVIPGSIGGNNLRVLKDLIEKALETNKQKLAKFGKVETVCHSSGNYEFLITKGFSQNAKNTFNCMEVCLEIAEGYIFAKKCVTEENLFHLILTKEKKA